MSVDRMTHENNDMLIDDLPSDVGMLKVGDPFPSYAVKALRKFKSETDFMEAINSDNANEAFTEISSSDYSGKWQVIFAWPMDFTFVCPTEIAGFNKLYSEFEDRDAELLGLSVDSEYVHLAWCKVHPDLKALKFPLLSDRKREISIQSGILDYDQGYAQRATFIIDPEGIIRFVMVTDSSVGRNPNEVLRILDALQTGGRCPCEWQKGDATI